jgi:hypothetical protein
MRETCGYIPVDRLDIIARRIFPYFTERHTPSFKGRMVFSREYMVAQALCFDLDPPYALQYFGSGHGYRKYSLTDYRNADKRYNA